jgi:HTH-type transcriptional regulator, sugar sensing transcriptional regulator
MVRFMTDQNTISLLQKLGLTFYGAKAYATLTTMGTTTPSKLATEAEIPPSRIYEVIKRLEEQKWVTVEKGRPQLVTPRCPQEVMSERRSILNSKIDKLTNEFTMNLEKRVQSETPVVSIIRGLENITLKTIEMMNRAKKEIFSFGSLYFPEDIEQIKEQVLNARRRNVTIRILTDRSIAFKNGELNLLEEFLQVTSDIQVAPLPYTRILTIDDKEMLMVFSLSESGMPKQENTIAIWIVNESIASYLNSTFRMDWEKYKSLRKKVQKG